MMLANRPIYPEPEILADMIKNNHIEIGMKNSKGLFKITLDRVSLALFMKSNWKVHKRGNTYYLDTTGYKNGLVYSVIIFHRVLMQDQNIEGKQIDHKNGDGLDNRMCNLRVATASQNQANQRIRLKMGSSKYKGVQKNANANSYAAKITVRGKTYALGSYKSETEAALVYDNAAKMHHGEFAYVNFITDEDRAKANIVVAEFYNNSSNDKLSRKDDE